MVRVVDTDAVDIATIIPLLLSSEAPDPVTSPTQDESAERVVSLACLARAAGIVGPAYLVVVDSQQAFGQRHSTDRPLRHRFRIPRAGPIGGGEDDLQAGNN